ncbi:MAG TPA: FAD-dependent oxidoreductase [Bacteroidia bacterium]|nr:FAD-dependent oxidoreductase [Bacteroidia bacterium]
MQKIAIIGTGIAGMSCGWFLHKDFDLTVYEALNYAGGHTNTVSVSEEEKEICFDTGFMVYNHVTYPLLTKLFEILGVETVKTSMSFSVQHVPARLEYCSAGLNGLYAQRKNIFSPRFTKMLWQVNRFNREAVRLLENNLEIENKTLAEFCAEKKLGQDFLHRYLIPMSAAVWSAPPAKMLEFPAQSLVRFFHNHGFLGLHTQHQWYTVAGGSRNYRDKIIAPFREKIRLNTPVSRVRKKNGKVVVRISNGEEEIFDKVIFACHADQALRLLHEPSLEEQRLLSSFKYQFNKATVHTDESVMPGNKRTWSSWNYRIVNKGKAETATTIYWMNSLQSCSERKNYFVSINDAGEIYPKKIISTIDYEHPLFDIRAVNAQKELPRLNEKGPLYYCGSYFRYGFHEDALMSSVDLCKHLLKREVL